MNETYLARQRRLIPLLLLPCRAFVAAVIGASRVAVDALIRVLLFGVAVCCRATGVEYDVRQLLLLHAHVLAELGMIFGRHDGRWERVNQRLNYTDLTLSNQFPLLVPACGTPTAMLHRKKLTSYENCPDLSNAVPPGGQTEWMSNNSARRRRALRKVSREEYSDLIRRRDVIEAVWEIAMGIRRETKGKGRERAERGGNWEWGGNSLSQPGRDWGTWPGATRRNGTRRKEGKRPAKPCLERLEPVPLPGTGSQGNPRSMGAKNEYAQHQRARPPLDHCNGQYNPQPSHLPGYLTFCLSIIRLPSDLMETLSGKTPSKTCVRIQQTLLPPNPTAGRSTAQGLLLQATQPLNPSLAPPPTTSWAPPMACYSLSYSPGKPPRNLSSLDLLRTAYTSSTFSKERVALHSILLEHHDVLSNAQISLTEWIKIHSHASSLTTAQIRCVFLSPSARSHFYPNIDVTTPYSQPSASQALYHADASDDIDLGSLANRALTPGTADVACRFFGGRPTLRWTGSRN
ncbi:hypothetical protein CCUS01_01261 [Colletotrichum cuscutae]|uniref:Uncharacterized protein n=1 Tax=Colletotrichum cuscutae TaxID=1209917 RepID=A0AAI9UZ66_9PEZI|nr:hypothetical protein CCUS01_01261 [Colletotrichum cuscutae]